MPPLTAIRNFISSKPALSATLLLGAALLTGTAHAQWTYPGCDNVSDSDFEVTPVVTRGTNDPSMTEPLKMAFDLREDGSVDVYYVLRHVGDDGVVRRYDGMNKTVSTVGSFPVHVNWEDGLVGIAMDPQFKSNRRIYLFYGHSSGWRISRFTLGASDLKLDLASEKVMITIPVGGDRRQHTGGGMQFDAYGDLWITVGDDKNTCIGPGNTADLRGKVLRIHPEEDGSYTIPKGNMWEFAADYFRGKGKEDVAQEYLDSTKMKREVFVMGTRNSFTLTLDPVRRWATYGNCGPDWAPKGSSDKSQWTEEHDLVTEPNFGGWPYWSANQHVTKKMPGSNTCKDDWKSMSPETPINNAGAIAELLPAKVPTHPYAHDCAMTGPIFRYDGRIAGTGQLPPHFNRVWFMTDFNSSKVWAGKLDDQGNLADDPVEIFKGLSDKLKKPLDFQQGPDGALYFLSYTCSGWRTADGCTGIYRITYKGSCKDPDLLPEEAPVSTNGRGLGPLERAKDYDLIGNAVVISTAGAHTLEIFSLNGSSIFKAEENGPARYTADKVFGARQPGLYQVRLTTTRGTATWIHPRLNRAIR